jgi:hypothetical protein
MQWVVWLDKHPGAAAALSNLLLVIVTAVIAGATVVYVVVTAMLWKATRDTACRTQELSRHASDTFLLQALVVLQEEVRAARDWTPRPGQGFLSPWLGIFLLEHAIAAAFPEKWAKIETARNKAVEEWKQQKGPQG